MIKAIENARRFPRTLLSRPGGPLLAFLAVASSGLLVARNELPQDQAVPQRTTPSQTHTEMSSPFSPWADGEREARSAALISSMKLVGVRVAADLARSGAILTLEDGAQRAFAVGDEIAPGVRLVDIEVDHVSLDAAGERRDVPLQQGYALGAINLASSPPAVATPVVVAAQPREWLASVLLKPEESVGAPYGWRIRGHVPDAAVQAGLQGGDLILSVNGLGPSVTDGAPDMSGPGPYELSVVRSTGERVTVAYAPQRRA